MSKREPVAALFLMRNTRSNEWKYMIIIPQMFDARKFPGWRYYKSFPNNGEGKDRAKQYAIGVEADEKAIADRKPL